jgi:hypothetical protein
MKKITLAFAVAMALMSFGCKKKGGGSGEAMSKMTEFKDEMCKCKDAKCAQDVTDKMAKWAAEQSKGQKEPPKMNEADTKKAQEIGMAMSECMTKAMGAGGAAPPADPAAAPPADPAAAGGGGDLPNECKEYKAAIEKLASCDKMPQQARDQLKKGFDDAAAGWEKLPAEAKAALNTACKAGTDAVMGAAKTTCGW